MDEPRSLKIVTVGLILAALAVGYFLLTGGFSVSKPKKVQTQNTQIAGVTSPSPTASPAVEPQPTASPSSAYVSEGKESSAYSRIAERTQSNIQTLPATGFPAGLTIVFSAGAIISGWSLRKYPE